MDTIASEGRVKVFLTYYLLHCSVMISPKKTAYIVTALFALLLAEPLFGTEASQYLTPAVRASVRLPVGNTSSHWLPYTTGGISLAMPSTIEYLRVVMGMEAGMIEEKESDARVQMIDVSFAVSVQLPEFTKGFGCSPFIGLSSVMIGINDGLIDFESTHVFSDVENEFGVIAGIVPYYRIGQLELQLPLFFERVLSSPARFNVMAVSLQVGYRFWGTQW